MKYRKKPVVIEALKFDGSPGNIAKILTWSGPKCGVEHRFTSVPTARNILVIETLEGEMRAFPGDWIIRGIKGEYYPCKSDIFEATYEAVNE